MSLSKIITYLERADGPNRGLDQSIALQVGYRLSIDQGLLDGERDRKIWRFGEPPKEVRLPEFTKSADAALDLTQLVGVTAPENDAAPIALCLHAMKELQRQRET